MKPPPPPIVSIKYLVPGASVLIPHLIPAATGDVRKLYWPRILAGVLRWSPFTPVTKGQPRQIAAANQIMGMDFHWEHLIEAKRSDPHLDEGSSFDVSSNKVKDRQLYVYLIKS